MTRADIINEVEKALDVRYAWSKNYDNGTILTEYGLYYKSKKLASLQIGFYTDDDKVISAGINFTLNGERHEFEIEKVEDIAEILKKVVP